MDHSPLMKLPPELRNNIYELVLRQNPPLRIQWSQSESKLYSHQYHKRRRSLSLTSTCKAIRTETFAMFYGINKFEIQSMQPYCDPDIAVRQFAAFIGPKALRCLKNVTFLHPAKRYDRRFEESTNALKAAAEAFPGFTVKVVIPFVVPSKPEAVKVVLDVTSLLPSLKRAIAMVEDLEVIEGQANGRAGLKTIRLALQSYWAVTCFNADMAHCTCCRGAGNHAGRLIVCD